MVDVGVIRVYFRNSTEISVLGLTPGIKGATALNSAIFYCDTCPKNIWARFGDRKVYQLTFELGVNRTWPFSRFDTPEKSLYLTKELRSMRKIKKAIAVFLLPYAEIVCVGLPYTNFTSRIIDKLIVASESD